MNAKMDIPIISSHSFFSTSIESVSFSSSSSCYWTQKFLCSRRNSDQENQQNNGNNSRDKYSTDWDKAWSSFRKRGNKKKKKKKSISSDFSSNKYVSWNPRRSEYPLSEEVDPIKRTERSNLMLWTWPGFTLAGAIVLVTFLLLYTILAPT